jgi:hypothetical protein
MKKTFLLIALLLAAPMLYAAHGGDDSTRTWYKLGLTERFRIETWDNTTTMSKAANGGTSYNRTRTNLTAQLFPHSNLELMLRLTNEFKFYFAPATRSFNSHELFFDQCYLKWKNDEIVPGVLTIGRQNIILGEGFLYADAGPLDGSRSFYFNAARFDYKPDSKNTLTALYNFETPKDVQLPILHNQDQPIIEQPEQGYGVYYEGQFDWGNAQAYVLRKHISAWNDSLPESHFSTVGARIAYPFFEKHFTATAEGSYQFGTHGSENRGAMGGYANLEYKPQANGSFIIPQAITAGGIYLSGDDPATEKYEGWDPLFSRYPKWSELYIYTLALEKGVAYWTDLTSINAKLLFALGAGFNYQFEFYYMTAPQQAAAANASAQKVFGSAKGVRGRLYINRLSYRISQSTTGYIQWEGFIPGSFYMNGADPTSWLRIEMMINL